jgi:hypothetical protein
MRRFSMAEHSHKWTLSHYVFPEEGDKASEYEHDAPYRVEVCTPECGDRRTVKMSQKDAKRVADWYRSPTTTTLSDEGGED